MKNSWDQLIKRADTLAVAQPDARELLLFYGKLLRAQKDIYDGLRAIGDWLPSGNLERDLPTVRPLISPLLKAVISNGPEPLAAHAKVLLQAGDAEIDHLMLDYWHNPSDTDFFAKAFLQPYGRWMVHTGAKPLDRDVTGVENRCPNCGGKPQLSFFFSKEQEGSNRMLLCATCLSEWNFRRVLCPGCLEEHPSKLGYFSAPEFEHVKVEACDTCKLYIKGVDLTVLGTAVPLVDEVAAAALDIWAREHGYEKIELNLLGI
jgi:FdhE protein